MCRRRWIAGLLARLCPAEVGRQRRAVGVAFGNLVGRRRSVAAVRLLEARSIGLRKGKRPVILVAVSQVGVPAPFAFLFGFIGHDRPYVITAQTAAPGVLMMFMYAVLVAVLIQIDPGITSTVSSSLIPGGRFAWKAPV